MYDRNIIINTLINTTMPNITTITSTNNNTTTTISSIPTNIIKNNNNKNTNIPLLKHYLSSSFFNIFLQFLFLILFIFVFLIKIQPSYSFKCNSFQCIDTNLFLEFQHECYRVEYTSITVNKTIVPEIKFNINTLNAEQQALLANRLNQTWEIVPYPHYNTVFQSICPLNSICDTRNSSLNNPPGLQNSGTLYSKCLEIDKYHYSSNQIVRKKVEYDFCDYHSHCASKKCTQQFYCEGLALNNTCNLHQQCEADTYCAIKIIPGAALDAGKWCQKRKLVTHKCTEDIECENNLGCFNGQCAYLFTFESGKSLLEENKTTDPTKLHLYCTSFFYDDRSYKCEDLISQNIDNLCIGKDEANMTCSYLGSISSRRYTYNNTQSNGEYCSCNVDTQNFECKRNSDQYRQKSYFLQKYYKNNCHFYNKENCMKISPELRQEYVKYEKIDRHWDVKKYPCVIDSFPKEVVTPANIGSNKGEYLKVFVMGFIFGIVLMLGIE